MEHYPVLKEKVLEYMKIEEGGIYVDATCGYGGHSRFILENSKNITLIGIDKDTEAVKRCGEILKEYKNFKAVCGGFENLKEILTDLGIEKVNGILFDLGFSLNQVKDPERGFGIYSEGPLDMRYDRNSSLTAAEILNRWSRTDLIRIFKDYGEIKRCERIVEKIVERRKRKKFSTTREFADFISGILQKRGKIHPATKFFLALRIAVNNELEVLKRGLSDAVEVLKSGGRILVISFNSLEDRIVKRFFKNRKGIRVITKKPIIPSEEEILKNPASRSAKLRVGEKI